MHYVALFFFLFLSQLSFAKFPQAEEELTRIAFGSCNFQAMPQDHWDVIAEQKPQLWIWGGDNIYADHLLPLDREIQYFRIKNNPHYRAFAQKTPIIGTWDDHDYGGDGYGKAYRYKAESQQLALDFLDEPTESVRRRQEGLYTTYHFGPRGHRIKIILLDVRYFRDLPGENGTIIGESQWSQLESDLLARDSELTLLVSGSQMLVEDHDGDKWANYPVDYQRILQLLSLTHGEVIVLSGDVHFAEFTKRRLREGLSVVEFTSSGMTHSHFSGHPKNRYRVGSVLTEKNFGVVEIQWGEKAANVNLKIMRIDGSLFQELPLKVEF